MGYGLKCGGDSFVIYCLDKNTTNCTSDAECLTRSGTPDVVCKERSPTTSGRGVTRCCQGKSCSTIFDCFSASSCCKPAFSDSGPCCTVSQSCIPGIGICFAF